MKRTIFNFQLRLLISALVSFNLLFFSERPLLANPTGGTVSSGSATISGGNGLTTIRQGSNSAIINWQSFSINQGETTKFIQPSSQSAVLNRVTGGSTSQINGYLTANGKVYLINGNGIIVGPSGVINAAGGFVGSTRDIADSDFQNKNLHFVGHGSGSVINQGIIRSKLGDVVLIGKTVDNQGTIQARGRVGLVAGDDVLLGQQNPDGSTIVVNATPLATSASSQVGVHNGGSIKAAAVELKAANGNIYALAIQNEGVIRATTVTHQGGQIFLTADSGRVINSGSLQANSGTVQLASGKGTTVNSGSIDVAGTQQGSTGGIVKVSGKTVVLTKTSTITATGDAGGGEVLVGGGFHGADPTISNAENTYVSAGSLITVDALTTGNGGKVAVWSDDQTYFAGEIDVKGGSISGNGGYVETSSENNLTFRGMVYSSAPNGLDGTLLLDPMNIIIGDPTVAYISDISGQPWGENDNINALNTVFGVGNWTPLYLETNGSSAFNPGSYSFVFVDGSDLGGADFATFVAANQTAIQNYVTGGGHILLNDAPNAGPSGNVPLVFGDSLTAFNFGSDATAVNPNHPIFSGPFGAVPTSYTGYYFAHSTINAPGSSSILVNENDLSVLTEQEFGAGILGLGGMTLPIFHSPEPAAYTLLDNILSYFSGDVAGNSQFSQNPSSQVTISPTQLTALTNAGTAVVLQANNDITVNAAILTDNPSGPGGNLTLQAGRSILLNANITTGNGNLTLIANDTAADGVVDANRQAGPAVITQAAGTTLNAGTGNVSIVMNSGAGNTNTVSGNISLQTVVGNTISVVNNGPTAGSNIVLNGQLTSTATTTQSIQIEDYNGSLQNLQGATALVTNPNSSWLVELPQVAGNQFGSLNSGNEALYNKPVGSAVATAADEYVFAQQPAITVTATNDSKAYGTAYSVTNDYSITGATGIGYTAQGFIDASAYGNVFTQDTSANTISGLSVTSTGSVGTAGVGPYSINASGSSVTGYALTFTDSGILTVNPKSITVTANSGQTITYGTATPTGNGSLTDAAPGLVNGDTLIGTLGGYVNTDSVLGGPYAITQGSVTNANNPNYNITYSGANFNVTPLGITVTANSGQTIVYGTTTATGNGSLTYVAPGLVNGDTLIGTLGGYVNTDSVLGGPYAITQGSVTNANNPNYNITYSGSNFNVTPLGITVTANSGQTIVYGTATATGNGSLTYAAPGLVNGDTLIGTLGGYVNTDSVLGGPYAITQGSVTNANNPNYNITYSGSNFNVAPLGITVTANSGQTIVYGTATATGNGSLTYAAPGLVNGDTLIGTLGGYVNTDSVLGGPYAITQGSVTNANNPNYNITYSGSNFNVTPLGITVTANSGQTIVYGTATVTGNESLTYAAPGLVNGDTLIGTLGGYVNTDSVLAGPYAITQGSVTNANNPNYNITYSGSNFNVTPLGITVTANSGQTIVYGTATATGNGSLTYGAPGLVNGDTLIGSLGGYVNTDSVLGGPYAITQGSVTNANNPNYNITYNGSNFNVTQLAITVTADSGQTIVYGTPNATGNGSLTYAAPGLVNGDTLTGTLGGYVHTDSVLGGPYGITQGSVTNPNYNITFVGTNFNVTPLGITVTANSGQTIPYGTSTATGNGSLTYTPGGLVNGDSLSGILGGYLVSDTVGGEPYAITQGSVTNANNPNYSITYAGANFNIVSKVVVLSAIPFTSTYGTASGLSYSVTGLLPGDVLGGTLTYATNDTFSGAGYLNTGSYSYNPVIVNYNSSYQVATTSAGFTINPAILTYVANQSVLDPGNIINPQGIVTGFVPGESLASATTGSLVFTTGATSSSAPGVYGIYGSGLNAQNYIFVQAPGNATGITIEDSLENSPSLPYFVDFEDSYKPPFISSLIQSHLYQVTIDQTDYIPGYGGESDIHFGDGVENPGKVIMLDPVILKRTNTNLKNKNAGGHHL